ncbi:MAG: hypothetical protein K6T65_13945 [Peptococcaceae bacterium]|nr:hypothetical protein [Peptococcaceae bacterium]
MRFAKQVADLSLGHQQYLAKNLKKLNIGLSEYPVLLFLYFESGNYGQNEIARRIKRNKALIARAVRNLIKTEYLYAVPSNYNNQRTLHLTEKGRSIVPQIVEIIDNWEKQILLALSEEEKALIKTIFEKIYNHSETWYANEMFS